MKSIDVRALIEQKNPAFKNYPKLMAGTLIKLLESVMRVHELNALAAPLQDYRGIVFIDEAFEALEFSYSISDCDRARIPADGKLIIVANHPLGALDGMALLKAVHDIRPDVKIIVNDVLMNIDNLADLFLPYDLFSRTSHKASLALIDAAVREEHAVIFFPAAKVSRWSIKGIQDTRWRKGPVHFSVKHQAPILPVFIQARNSKFFYLLSLLSKTASMFLLAAEIIKQRRKRIQLSIGHPIPAKAFHSSLADEKTIMRLLKKHVYRIGRKKRGVFLTERTIVHPVDRMQLRQDMQKSELLGTTHDGQQIFLVHYDQAPHALREIGRLRELTFRKIGEGTGLKIDLDGFDRYYQHIILWDDEALEIVGAYRVGDGRAILKERGVSGLYTATLFNYQAASLPVLKQSLELGRSFVQEKYWRSNALEYLWQGIGAYLCTRPDVKYLLGPVSISADYSEQARNALVYFYQKWFGAKNSMCLHKHPYRLSYKTIDELSGEFANGPFEIELRKLKESLKMLGFSIPVLYKQYTDLCDDGGVQFLDFGVDPNFSNCVDGLILVELSKLKEIKRKRYLQRFEKPENDNTRQLRLSSTAA